MKNRETLLQSAPGCDVTWVLFFATVLWKHKNEKIKIAKTPYNYTKLHYNSEK